MYLLCAGSKPLVDKRATISVFGLWFGVVISFDPCSSKTLKFHRAMTGGRAGEAIGAFWEHCRRLDEWRDHPVLNDPSTQTSRV